MFDRTLNEVLGNRTFNLGVDLGCGAGTASLREHCKTIIGVDHNLPRLSVAKEFSKYDEVVCSDVRDYNVPYDVDALFMIEVIEHFSKEDGYLLLRKVSHVPFILITTPTRFFPISLRNGHVSLWTLDDFEGLGYEVSLRNRFPLIGITVGQCIIAIKER